MRSDLVFGALSSVSNRYQLCQLASKATRKLHKPNTRLQDTTNEVLVRFHSTNPASRLRQKSLPSGRLRRVARLNIPAVSLSELSKQLLQGGHFEASIWPLHRA